MSIIDGGLFKGGQLRWWANYIRVKRRRKNVCDLRLTVYQRNHILFSHRVRENGTKLTRSTETSFGFASWCSHSRFALPPFTTFRFSPCCSYLHFALWVQLNIDYPTTSGQTTVRRCSDKANVPDKKKTVTHTLSVVITSRTTFLLFTFQNFRIFWMAHYMHSAYPTARAPKKLLRIIEWSDSRCADNRCSTVYKPIPIQISHYCVLMIA